MHNSKSTFSNSSNEFKLDNENGNNLHRNKEDSYDCFMSADVSKSSTERLPSMFELHKPVFKTNRSNPEPAAKVMCYCCRKEEHSALLSSSLNSDDNYLWNRCTCALNKKQEYAKKYNGTVKISTQSKNLVEYTCELGHSWTVSINRTYKSWCSTCRKILREEKKKQFRRQSSFIRRENERKQREMFNEAQNYSILESRSEATLGPSTFEDLFNSILAIAKAKAQNFVSLNSSETCSYEQALSVYKIIELDENRAKFIIDRMSDSSKKQGYKRFAIALHPDKNRHPLSKEAFQKASELFNSSN